MFILEEEITKEFKGAFIDWDLNLMSGIYVSRNQIEGSSKKAINNSEQNISFLSHSAFHEIILSISGVFFVNPK